MADIINSYDNTEELKKRFPVINETPVETELEKNIQNRLLTGFENWNRGTEAWMEWGDILYTKDSLYNVHGVHLTLKEYQMTSNLSMKANDLQMGNFNNMVICGDWTAIRYDITTTNRQSGESHPGSVMEFVNFKDYGPELGTRVVEGWAGTRGADYPGLLHFLTEEEKAAQDAAMEKLENMELPQTDRLEEKYPVLHPTRDNSPWAAEIRAAILNDFEKWNQGFETWSAWAGQFYDSALAYHTDDADMDLNAYLDSVKAAAEKETVTRMYFENMLISGEWAAIHYREVATDKATGQKTGSGRMQFLHFKKTEDGVKVFECWTK